MTEMATIGIQAPYQLANGTYALVWHDLGPPEWQTASAQNHCRSEAYLHTFSCPTRALNMVFNRIKLLERYNQPFHTSQHQHLLRASVQYTFESVKTYCCGLNFSWIKVQRDVGQLFLGVTSDFALGCGREKVKSHEQTWSWLEEKLWF